MTIFTTRYTKMSIEAWQMVEEFMQDQRVMLPVPPSVDEAIETLIRHGFIRLAKEPGLQVKLDHVGSNR